MSRKTEFTTDPAPDDEPLPVPVHVREWAERVGRTIAIHLEARRHVLAQNALEAEIARAAEIWSVAIEMVAELPLPLRTVNVLESAGILSINSLCATTNAQLLAISGVHATTVRAIDRALSSVGKQRADAVWLNGFLKELGAQKRAMAIEKRRIHHLGVAQHPVTARRVNTAFGDLPWLKPNRRSS